MTGIEKGSFLDKTTGFREIGDGLMVIDWLMRAIFEIRGDTVYVHAIRHLAQGDVTPESV